ncbi:MAG: hypothetical protein HLX50_14110 [Alteromonadaceae bacterium]|nr:hypothetical protein [Alteromonadaceae bacterium]
MTNRKSGVDVNFEKLPGETLVGRRNGQIAKEYLKLDELFEAQPEISVNIPNKFKAITSSFFLGMFESYIISSQCKKDIFYKKFKFYAPPRLLDQIDTGLDDAIEANDGL